ncbi:MAG TPA: 1-deoxy-D-xylulose-5-phosphate reductoisomerase [Candidatus Acetothermia bacterium]|nr:1-deoxy-D-xylulose-5-phosphate reductoisomerase [Candidatus Acetothermia bacterium]
MTRERCARRMAVLGSTGSIGTQTLDVVERLRAAGWVFEVTALAAGSNTERLLDQVDRFRPRWVSLAEDEAARSIVDRLPHGVSLLGGPNALTEMAALPDVDVVLNAVYGAAGLEPTLAALDRGKTVALANKESIVIGGSLITSSLQEHGGTLLSVDSEHHALHQCLHGHRSEDVARLILTASGGPLWDASSEELERVTPEQALDHPSWSMGRKITVDSATLVNKAFEVIVAHFLYGVPYDRIAVVIQPSSHLHSMVEFHDGSIKAELGPRDMRIPIQNLLIHPHRVDTGLPKLSFGVPLEIQLMPFDVSRFPAYATILEAAQEGETALAAMNAADEALIYRFLEGQIPFLGIARGLQAVLQCWREEQREKDRDSTLSIERVLAVDAWSRALASSLSL